MAGRYVRGPGVGSVARVVSNTRRKGKGPEARSGIDRRRALEARVQAAEQDITAHKETLYKERWVERTTRKAKAKAAEMRMQEILDEEQQELERRRAKLRQMLADEERHLLAEAAAQVETPLEKQARMRERVRELREERESDRQREAKERKRQQFLMNSEPVRQLKRKQELEKLVQHRDVQLKEKEIVKQHEKEVDEFFSRMWLEDKASKDRRYAEEQQQRAQRARQQQMVLNEQMQAVEQARQQQLLLVEEERKLRLQAQEQAAIEAKRQQEEERRGRQRMMAELDRFNKQTIELRAQEAQRELEQDLQYLQENIDAVKGEAEAERERKAQVMQEVKMYNDYIQQMKAFEKQRERQAMQALLDKLERERQARQQLLDEVMQTRRQQIDAKLQAVELEKMEAAQEYHNLVRAIKEQEAAEEERKKSERIRAREAAKALQEQAQDNARRRREEEQRQADEARRLREMDRQYEETLTRELQSLAVTGTSAH
ncbi:hypothetical protein PTSG_11264 [Salpingoeca rosetta]|uniref:Cilia- and flagella-associated protein 53 n=1 Tax=Salpingoeca rosetta (strain ATCC 50818 / BSB-021) TaxID=946362 RepID=F2USW8_SALR5|nr:uncharacterized protein PTSG_11264 [Salpingoeca rosetta]EGD81227.1 hypothetical protein PTSG_11264 [Salpingoeca rosetta]|eukprot:XP_004987761.1 hypothetical protein PTSG_11264 [Salpingoeca rosetta]